MLKIYIERITKRRKIETYYSEKYGYDENYGYGTSYYEFYVGGSVPKKVLRDQEKEIKSSSERKLKEFWLENEECKKNRKQ